MTHTFNRVKDVEEVYGKISYDEEKGKYYINAFHGTWYKNAKFEFVQSLRRYYEIIEKLEANGETPFDAYLDKRNEIWIKSKTREGQEYEFTMRVFGKIEVVRNKLSAIVDKNGHKLLSTYTRHDRDVLIDFCCGHPAQWVNPDSYMAGHNKCRYCTNERTLPYVNDIYAKRPDLLKYFINEKDAIGIAPGKISKKMMFRCPYCGYEREYWVRTLCSAGFSCKNCGDGISYPEKMMANILNDLGFQYQTEKTFDWCHYEIDGTEYRGYYDFILDEQKIIIEMDGGFHYKESDFGSLELVQKKDEWKTKLAQEHGWTIYRVECNYINQSEKFAHVKNSIIDTLGDVFDLSSLNWDDLAIRADKPVVIEAARLWNEGYSCKYIRDELHISVTAFREYLNRARNIGICTYTKEGSFKRTAYFNSMKHNKFLKAEKDGEIIAVFWHYGTFIKRYTEKYGFPMNRAIITNVLREEKKKSLDGVTFQEITQQEYTSLLTIPGIITDDGLGNNPEFRVRIFPEYLTDADIELEAQLAA